MDENERLAAITDNAEHDVRHVTELLDKSDKERKRLSDRNAQLTINGMNCGFPFLSFSFMNRWEGRGGGGGGGVSSKKLLNVNSAGRS